MKWEPWKGQTDEAKAPKVKFPKRSRQSILNPENRNSELLPVLEYGCRYKYEKREIIISETCANDSYFQIFFALYADSNKCKALIDDSVDQFSSIIKLAMNERVMAKVNFERGEFLRRSYNEYCNKNDARLIERISKECDEKVRKELEKLKLRPKHFRKETEKMEVVDCNISINSIFDMICENSIFHSIDLFTVCQNCKFIFKKAERSTIPVFTNAVLGIENLQNCLDERLQIAPSPCYKCGQTLEIVKRPNRIIVIDAESFKERLSADSPLVEFANITQQIKFTINHYNLKGVIERKEISTGHFVSHVKRNSGSWETFDNIRPMMVGRPSKKMHPVQLIYLMEEEENVDDNFENNFKDLSKNTINLIDSSPKTANGNDGNDIDTLATNSNGIRNVGNRTWSLNIRKKETCTSIHFYIELNFMNLIYLNRRIDSRRDDRNLRQFKTEKITVTEGTEDQKTSKNLRRSKYAKTFEKPQKC